MNPTINQSTNRFTAGQNYGYDVAGNLTSDPATNANGIVYDAENRQTQYTKTGQQTNYYYYDGDGNRVKKIDNSGTTVFVYNAGGQLIAEYTSGPPSGGGTSYLTSDHLGSTRVVMKPDGSVARHDYLPFGEETSSTIGGRGGVAGYGAPDSTRQKFTQKERDSESGLDYFLARYYSSAQGRFTSPDEFTGGPLDVFVLGSGDEEKQALPYADITAPQSLNKYQYAYNNPLRYIDPNGHDVLGYELLISGTNHVPKQDRREVSDVANLGPKDTSNGGYYLLNLRTDFDKGDNLGDYKHVRAAIILNDRTIRNDGQENPSGSQIAVEGQSRFVTDNPGLGVSGQPKASLAGNTTLFAFVAGEYNTKTKELSSNVAYYAVKLVFGKNGQLDTSQSAAIRITRDQFIQLAQQRNVALPKDKKKQDCPECLLSPPNQARR